MNKLFEQKPLTYRPLREGMKIEAKEDISVVESGSIIITKGTEGIVLKTKGGGNGLILQVHLLTGEFEESEHWYKDSGWRECQSAPLTDTQLTTIYNTANNIGEGKAPPITTQFIFAAMRLSYHLGKTGGEL